MHKRIGILGYGEVGQSLHHVYQDKEGSLVFIRDLKRDDKLIDLDVLNVCIPYSSIFSETVQACARESNAKLIIIHSTTPPGTTTKLAQWGHKLAGIHIVHSPVMGVHPNLYESLKEFIKFVGAISYEDAQLAVSHLNEIGINAEFIGNPITSELGKLLSTTYYGLCIAWHGEMYKMCATLGVDFDQAVTRFNESYNDGYAALGKANVVRPTLTPPMGENAHIGGHCIVSNAELLKSVSDSKALELVIDYKKDRNNS